MKKVIIIPLFLFSISLFSQQIEEDKRRELYAVPKGFLINMKNVVRKSMILPPMDLFVLPTLPKTNSSPLVSLPLVRRKEIVWIR